VGELQVTEEDAQSGSEGLGADYPRVAARKYPGQSSLVDLPSVSSGKSQLVGGARTSGH
jgi:hypothetical protein